MDSGNTRSAALINIVDRNTLVWWELLLVSLWLAAAVGPWGGLFWAAALAVDDVLFWVFGTSSLFDSELRVRRNYQWMHALYDGTTGAGRDLGFNLAADGGFSQHAKFEHMARQLGLRKGMRICDVGCGYGDWLKYCRDVVGCEAVGVNITPEQADYARREYGLEAHTANWKDILDDPRLQARLFGRFDAVTFMDTVEHYVGMEDRRDLEKQRKVYADMCYLAFRLLDGASPARRVFISCLHQTRKPRTWRFYWHAYLMDKFYAGHYPFVDEGPLAECRSWFDVVSVADKTEDYRLTGVRDRGHFQAVRIRPTPRKAAYAALMVFLDPYVLHRLVYYANDSWMYFYGEDPYSRDYDAERRKRVSWVLLYWITLEAKRAGTTDGLRAETLRKIVA
jgi:cyclopropane fatty-acyl-phospholipid synthase-like methyltransferase